MGTTPTRSMQTRGLNLGLILALISFLSFRLESIAADERLSFDLPVAAHVKTSTGQVLIGNILEVSNESIVFSPSLGGGSNTTLDWDEVKTLVLPGIGMRYRGTDSVEEFIEELLTHDELSIVRESAGASNPVSSQSLPHESGTPASSAMNDSNSPSKGDLGGPLVVNEAKITVTCGTCMREVSGDSDSGQTCPHCGILWDENPFATETLRPLDKELAEVPLGNGQLLGPAPVNNRQPEFDPNRPPEVNPEDVPVPAPAPPPVQANMQPQEMTLANLPLWVKASIFAIALGVLYYSVFYIR